MTTAYGYAYRQVRARMVRDAQVCAICGGALDKSAPPRSPLSPSVDHILPVKRMRFLDAETRRRLLVDPHGLRVTHLKCNSSRGAGREQPRHISRSW